MIRRTLALIFEIPNDFTELVHWVDSVLELQCPSVCRVCVMPSDAGLKKGYLGYFNFFGDGYHCICHIFGIIWLVDSVYKSQCPFFLFLCLGVCVFVPSV